MLLFIFHVSLTELAPMTNNSVSKVTSLFRTLKQSMALVLEINGRITIDDKKISMKPVVVRGDDIIISVFFNRSGKVNNNYTYLVIENIT